MLFNPPECTITSVSQTDASGYQPAAIVVTVQNRGNATAFNVECDVTLKSGSTIVDEAVMFFGTLEAGESISEEGLFWNIRSHADYSTATYHLFWYDSQGTYHE